MSSTSVLSRPKVNRSVSRNGFDRSHRFSFNMSAGMLLPLDWRVFPAGSRVKLGRDVFIRTADVNTAAFTPLDFHVSYFKVPIRLLWSKWNDFKLRINDLNSSALFYKSSGELDSVSLGINAGCPQFDINRFESALRSEITGAGGTINKAPIDSLGYLYINGFYRLRDMLRYGGKGAASESYATNPAFTVNMFPALAYQKIYFDHFRNTAYESNDPFAYNIDWIPNDTTIIDSSAGDSFVFLKKMFTLRYVNYRNDFLHNIYPALNFVNSSPTGLDWSVPSSVVGTFSSVSPSTNNGGLILVNSNVNIGGQNVGRAVSVQNIRAGFALDKLMRASAYAPKHVKEQFEALFGVKMSDKVSHQSERVADFQNDIKLMEVTSTSDTSGASLGAIGAKGIGSGQSGKLVETYCEEDSIIMCVGYILPRASYDAFGSEKWLTNSTPEEFYNEILQNLGLEPVYFYEYSRLPFDGTSNNSIVGYRPRYQIYKDSIDLNHGEFRYNNPQYIYDPDEGVVPEGTNSLILDNGSRTLSAFVVHSLSDYIGGNTVMPSNGVSSDFFKVSPEDVNPLFVGQYNKSGAQILDQFYGFFEQKFKAIQPMDVFGLPNI